MDYVVTKCKIEQYALHNEIWVTVNTGESFRIGNYYPDELHFEESEFVGLKLNEAKQLIRERDLAYLIS